jgi:hypothetical protein
MLLGIAQFGCALELRILATVGELRGVTCDQVRLFICFVVVGVFQALIKLKRVVSSNNERRHTTV